MPDTDHAGHPAAVAPGVAPHSTGLTNPEVVAVQFAIVTPAVENVCGAFTGEAGGPGLEAVTLDVGQR